MAVTNVFRPSTLGFKAYGWKGASVYNSADVPTRWLQGASAADKVIIEQQLAYEWLNSGDSGGNWNDMGPKSNLVSTNPPFLSGAAGRLMPGLSAPNGGGPPRILRGFIRRAESDLSDPVAMSRLYFMFNPETITRDYVSYLDQGALDPFNTVFQSGNLVAPPSYMDFTFSLLFDRQEEAADPAHPGVFVDYQYFDLVVRNVIPTTDPNAMNSTLPDNGVMMVNPRDITVIFSPQITIQGRPSNARVSFQKFTHRMVPTRMQIDLTMRVVYFGPMRDMNPYVKETDVTAATVPLVEFEDPLNISPGDMVRYYADLQKSIADIANTIPAAQGAPDPGTGTPVLPGASTAQYPPGTLQADINVAESSRVINKQIMDHAKNMVASYHTTYNSDNPRPWPTADCSALVYQAFLDQDPTGKSFLLKMGWSTRSSLAMWNAYLAKMSTPNSHSAVSLIFTTPAGATRDQRKPIIDAQSIFLIPGDLLFRINAVERTDGKNHVAWFSHWDSPLITGPAGKPNLFDAYGSKIPGNPGVGLRPIPYTELYDYTGAIRPLTSS